MKKDLKCLPIRSCLNKIAPGESNLIIRAATSKSGKSRTSPSKASRSQNRTTGRITKLNGPIRDDDPVIVDRHGTAHIHNIGDHRIRSKLSRTNCTSRNLPSRNRIGNDVLPVHRHLGWQPCQDLRQVR